MACKECGNCCKVVILDIPANQFNLENKSFEGLWNAHYEKEGGMPDPIRFRIPHRCSYLDDLDRCEVHDTDKMPDFCKNFMCKKALED